MRALVCSPRALRSLGISSQDRGCQKGKMIPMIDHSIHHPGLSLATALAGGRNRELAQSWGALGSQDGQFNYPPGVRKSRYPMFLNLLDWRECYGQEKASLTGLRHR
jgi:hypothetical protein